MEFGTIDHILVIRLELGGEGANWNIGCGID